LEIAAHHLDDIRAKTSDLRKLERLLAKTVARCTGTTAAGVPRLGHSRCSALEIGTRTDRKNRSRDDSSTTAGARFSALKWQSWRPTELVKKSYLILLACT